MSPRVRVNHENIDSAVRGSCQNTIVADGQSFDNNEKRNKNVVPTSECKCNDMSIYVSIIYTRDILQTDRVFSRSVFNERHVTSKNLPFRRHAAPEWNRPSCVKNLRLFFFYILSRKNNFSITFNRADSKHVYRYKNIQTQYQCPRATVRQRLQTDGIPI